MKCFLLWKELVGGNEVRSSKVGESVEETGDLTARADGSQGGMGVVVPFDSVVRRGRELIMD